MISLKSMFSFIFSQAAFSFNHLRLLSFKVVALLEMVFFRFAFRTLLSSNYRGGLEEVEGVVKSVIISHCELFGI